MNPRLHANLRPEHRVQSDLKLFDEKCICENSELKIIQKSSKN